ncbi:MAG: holo-ACP synthase [Clostridia bacterium]|nr:holo-ACP synthase [Clostridia bacterium]
MIHGNGIDLCEIRRIEAAIQNPHFLERVYTQRERERIDGAAGVRQGEIAAGLFAAKEAVAKALGTGFDGFGPQDIEITPGASGQPVCTLRDGAGARAAALAGARYRLFVSVTHEAGLAAAMAILEG